MECGFIINRILERKMFQKCSSVAPNIIPYLIRQSKTHKRDDLYQFEMFLKSLMHLTWQLVSTVEQRIVTQIAQRCKIIAEVRKYLL